MHDNRCKLKNSDEDGDAPWTQSEPLRMCEGYCAQAASWGKRGDHMQRNQHIQSRKAPIHRATAVVTESSAMPVIGSRVCVCVCVCVHAHVSMYVGSSYKLNVSVGVTRLHHSSSSLPVYN